MKSLTKHKENKKIEHVKARSEPGKNSKGCKNDNFETAYAIMVRQCSSRDNTLPRAVTVF